MKTQIESEITQTELEEKKRLEALAQQKNESEATLPAKSWGQENNTKMDIESTSPQKQQNDNVWG